MMTIKSNIDISLCDFLYICIMYAIIDNRIILELMGIEVNATQFLLDTVFATVTMPNYMMN